MILPTTICYEWRQVSFSERSRVVKTGDVEILIVFNADSIANSFVAISTIVPIIHNTHW